MADFKDRYYVSEDGTTYVGAITYNKDKSSYTFSVKPCIVYKNAGVYWQKFWPYDSRAKRESFKHNKTRRCKSTDEEAVTRFNKFIKNVLGNCVEQPRWVVAIETRPGLDLEP